MTFFFFVIGLVPPVLIGYLVLRLLQGKTRVLTAVEEWSAGMLLGLLFMAHLFFLLHILFGMQLERTSMLLSCSILIALLGGLFFLLKPASARTVSFVPSATLGTSAKILMGAGAVWVLVKLLVSATIFSGLTPTYFDDSFDNWNLRAKVYFHTQELVLGLPGEDPLTSRFGIGSYPPAIPMMKTWLVSLYGEWNEPLQNLLHVVFYIAIFPLLYCALRRYTSRGWSALGTYMLGSMPLYLIHGTNAYADLAMSVYTFLAVFWTYRALIECNEQRTSFMRLSAVSVMLPSLIKNEGLLIILPPILFLSFVSSLFLLKQKRAQIDVLLHWIVWLIISFLVFVGPWLLFKWHNGLTFGNAKPVSTLGVGFNADIPRVLFINTFMEGNWILLFPLLLTLLVWKCKKAFGSYFFLTLYIFIVLSGQAILYTFTGLSVEARMQTGLARGIIQQLPIVILLTTLLLAKKEVENGCWLTLEEGA